MESIGSFACVTYKGEMFFSHLEYNSLYKMNLENLSVEWVGCFPDVKIDKKLIHRKAIIWNDEVFFFPLNGNKIHKYTPEKNEVVSVCNIEIQGTVRQLVFSDVVHCDSKVYLIPNNNNGEFIEFNLDTFQIRIVKSWKKMVLDRIDKEFRIAQCATVCESDKLFTVVCDTNSIISYDTVSEKVDIINLRNDVKLRNIEVCGNEFVFSLVESHTILCWNFRTEEYRYITDDRFDVIFRPFVIKDEVYMLPEQGAILYVIHDDENLICNISNANEGMEKLRFRSFLEEKGQIYFMPRKGKKLMLFDENNCALKLESVQFINTPEKHLFENDLIRCWSSEGCLNEDLDTGFSLSRFINFISEEKI